MKKIFNIFIRAFIPTLCMCIIVSNMFTAQTEGKCMQLFTIFTFSFVMALSLTALLLRIEKLEEKVKDIEVRLEKIEKKLNNE